MNSIWTLLKDNFRLISSVAGVILVPAAVFNYFRSVELAVAVGIAIWSIVLLVVVRHYIPDLGRWRTKVRGYSSPSFVGRRTMKIDVDEKYRAVVMRSSELIFLQEPTAGDLVDIITFLPGETAETHSYASPDSISTKVVTSAGNSASIYWKPASGSIKRFVPYLHTMQYVSADLYGEDAFYHSVLVDRHIGHAVIEIQCALPVSSAVAFVAPWHATQITPKLLYKFGVLRDRHCEQPTVSGQGHKIVWQFQNPRLGRQYVLLAIYAGEEERYRTASESLFWRLRFRNWWAQKTGRTASDLRSSVTRSSDG